MGSRTAAWFAGASIAAGFGTATQAAVVTVVEQGFVGVGSAAAERVLCPDGQVALGGGLDPNNVLLMRLTSSAPAFGDANDDRLMLQPNGPGGAPIAWQASTRNEDTVPHTFNVGAICATDTTLSTVVAADFVDVSEQIGLRVFCPEGSVAVGGGVDVGNIGFVTVNSQGPLFGDAPGSVLTQMSVGTAGAPSGWEATVRNGGGSSQQFKVAAICSSELEAVTVIGSFPLPGSNFGGTRLQCPAGLIASGGGMRPADPATARETADAPAFGTDPFDRLYTQTLGTIEAPVAWQGDIVNEAASVGSARLGVVCVPEPGALASALATAGGCCSVAGARRRRIRG
jgi:hypothetical protein